ncbi:hypothetical protein [Sulfuricurvum sp.]|uniref:hypothetical protein n=1 Tax=Sulfuricurvum sp. TaxID=2025608 RepID=UPI00356A86E9
MDNNQTNIEKADEIAGYLTNAGILSGKSIAPYIDFLTANPAALTNKRIRGQVFNLHF